MATPAVLAATGAAAKRRTFAASQKKGPTSGAPPAPPTAPSQGPVAGLDSLNKPAPAGPAVSPYIQHALALSGAAQQNGAPELASTIRAVAAVPHPADKHVVAMNYLRANPATAQQHQHMFTPKLMSGAGVGAPPAPPGAGVPPGALPMGN